MVSELNITSRTTADFPLSAPAAYPVFFRTYSRFLNGGRENWQQVCTRTLRGLVKLGNLDAEEAAIIDRMQRQVKALPSGRWLWVGGSEWLERPENFSGAYNCTSTNVIDWRAFGLMMDLAMMGCGTGAILEPELIDQLPAVRNLLEIGEVSSIGTTPAEQRRHLTDVEIEGNHVTIHVGDSRQGWVKSYQTVLELCSDDRFSGTVKIDVDLADVRPAGELLKGFGGMANPVKLPELYARCVRILNKAHGRKLNSVECCLLIDEAAVTIVAGNIRRCLPENSLVHTSKGLVPIKDIQIGDQVQTPLGFRSVVNKFDQGMQEVFDVDTNATVPRATLNHRYAVLTSAKGDIAWKKVSELNVGDRLLHSTQVLSGTVSHLPEDFTAVRPEQSRTAKALIIPELTVDIAWLIGFTHGDGYVALGRNTYDKPYGRVEWAMNGKEVELTAALQVKIDRALALFSLTANHGTVKGENTAKSICTSIRFAEYFHRYIKQPKQSLVIPQFILQGSIDIRSAYLAGLMDSDGAVNNRPPHLVTTVYRDFVAQASSVLSSLGIAGRISITVPQEENWQLKYNLTIPAMKAQYNALIAPHSAKGELKQGLKMYGFTVPGEIMREAYTYSEMRGMGFQGNRSVDSNYERYMAESDINLDIPVTVKGLGRCDYVQTYDIEVEEAHCFYCDGYLTHNSAGMRQFNSTDTLGANAKDNLWQQGEDGSWKIDPERDSLRMANHTRVFHRKPTLEECVDAVRKQYYSGEGAIQWAGEAVARSNADLVNTPERKKEFIAAYDQGKAQEWIKTHCLDVSAEELGHRMLRYGLNPCVTADTWVHTEEGARQVKDLIGKQHGTYINGELFSTTVDGFFFSGVKPVLKMTTKEGHTLRLTGNHRVLKVTTQTQKAQYTEWVEAADLQAGDRVMIHNHRGLQPWIGQGTSEEGWLLGNLIGDGCFSVSEKYYQYQANLRYWGDTQVEMKEYALALANGLNPTAPKPLRGVYHQQNQYYQVNSAPLAKLAKEYGVVPENKTVTSKIEEASYDFYCGFLRGLFDADGSVQGNQISEKCGLGVSPSEAPFQDKGISVRLAQSNELLLQAVQRMLLRLGIGSRIYRNRRPEQVRLLPDSQRQPAEYNCKAQHELVIANDNLPVFLETIGFQEPQKQELLISLLSNYKRQLNRDRFSVKIAEITPDGTEAVYDCTVPGVNRFDANGFVAHNCGEILGSNFHCNLSEVHLNQLDPHNIQEQEDAFRASALSVAALLNHQFQEPRYQYSRLQDPIVGVSFTGLFDFFVHAFGTPWLEWWATGRPATEAGKEFKAKEAEYLTRWATIVHEQVWAYCDKHGIKRPNRCTTTQPAGTKSLLTGASPGWHPPKAQRFIRRITFRKNDPVALACIEYGYSAIPSQSDKDENGNLLNDPFDPRCTEWLIEIPVAVSWADIPGADQIEISKFDAMSQMDFCMQVQKHYTTHNTSATIELREAEIELLGQKIFEAIRDDEGYISAALLARFDDLQTFPRLPFEPIDKATYDQLMLGVQERQMMSDFAAALAKYDSSSIEEAGPAGCDSDKCLLPDKK